MILSRIYVLAQLNIHCGRLRLDTVVLIAVLIAAMDRHDTASLTIAVYTLNGGRRVINTNHMIRLTKPLTLVYHSAHIQALAVLGTVGAFFAPEAYTFSVVLIAIILDAIFGVTVSIKNGGFLLSKLMRVTFFKMFSYGAALTMVLLAERLLHDSGLVGIKVAAGWALACEFWSMSASILIIWPDAYFFRIMRVHLRGEMQAKLGTNIDDILPPEKTP
jgi:hypothetical protein